MKYVLILLLLCGCAKQPVSETIAQNAVNTATAIEKTLPKQCATDVVKTQIESVKTQITAIVQACETEKAEITAEKIRWKWAFLGLLTVVLAFIAKKIMK